MIDVAAIRHRAETLERDLEQLPKSVPRKLRAEIASVLRDVEQLLHEIAELQSLCTHLHLIETIDRDGNHTGAYTCVNCHRTISKESPLEERSMLREDE